MSAFELHSGCWVPPAVLYSEVWGGVSTRNPDCRLYVWACLHWFELCEYFYFAKLSQSCYRELSPKQTNYVNGLLTASYKYLYFDPKQSSTSGKESASGKRKQTSKVALAVWLWMRRAAGEAALSTLEAAGPHLYIVMAAVTRCSADC